MSTYIVKLNEVTVELFNSINPNFPRLSARCGGAVVFKVDTKQGSLSAKYAPYLNKKQKQRLMDSLEECHLNKINQVRLENLLEE